MGGFQAARRRRHHPFPCSDQVPKDLPPLARGLRGGSCGAGWSPLTLISGSVNNGLHAADAGRAGRILAEMSYIREIPFVSRSHFRSTSFEIACQAYERPIAVELGLPVDQASNLSYTLTLRAADG